MINKKATKLLNVILLLITILLGVQFSTPANAEDSALDFRRPDQQQHLAVSYGLTLTGVGVLRGITPLSKTEAVYVSVVTVLAIGAAKEVFFDKAVSVGDMKANAVGVAGGVMVPLVFNF
jgi:hypothetical protein